MPALLLVQSDNKVSIPLASGLFHVVVTSPPYWGLRDYGTGTWIGGSPDCQHVASRQKSLKSGLRNDGREHKGLYDGEKSTEIKEYYRDVCGKCGAIRKDNQLGLEALHDCGAWSKGPFEPYIAWRKLEIDHDEDDDKFDEPEPIKPYVPDQLIPYIAWRRISEIQLCGECYVCNMLATFREVRRVMRDDGVLFLNLGDSYNGSSGSGGDTPKQLSNHGSYHDAGTRMAEGLKPKDLVGIPWRVALALQADGWYLRSDVIWSKVNPMPESVVDRPTKSHEYVFVLTKSARYYWDAEAVKEPQKDVSLARLKRGSNGDGQRGYPGGIQNHLHKYVNKTDEEVAAIGGRNIRTVWEIPTQPYPGAHYACYPEALVERCLKAAGSEWGCCPECGSPWVRVMDITPPSRHDSEKQTIESGRGNGGDRSKHGTPSVKVTIGWRPTCNHYERVDEWQPIPAQPDDMLDEDYQALIQPIKENRAELVEFWKTAKVIPCTILDPFIGSGTTLLVAKRLGMHGVGIDLKFEYLKENAWKRIGMDQLSLL